MSSDKISELEIPLTLSEVSLDFGKINFKTDTGIQLPPPVSPKGAEFQSALLWMVSAGRRSKELPPTTYKSGEYAAALRQFLGIVSKEEAVSKFVPFLLQSILPVGSRNLSVLDVLKLALDLCLNYQVSLGDIFVKMAENADPRTKLILKKLRDSYGLRFDEYFKMMMEDEDVGFYASNSPDEVIGAKEGAFTTHSEKRAFAELMAYDLFGRWVKLGRPERFDIVEMGAGRGVFAQNLLNFILNRDRWQEFFGAIDYTIIEMSPKFAKRQLESLAPFGKVTVVNASAIDFSLNKALNGVVFSNELIDMFPPRKFVYRNGGWNESFVAAGEYSTVVESSIPVKNAVALGYLNRYFPRPYRGQTEYFQADIKPWIENVARHLKKGWVISFDYWGPEENGSAPNKWDIGFRTMFQRSGLSAFWGSSNDKLNRNVPASLAKYFKIEKYFNSPFSIFIPQDFTVDANFELVRVYGESAGLITESSQTESLFFKDVLAAMEPRDVAWYQACSEGEHLVDASGKMSVDATDIYELLNGERADGFYTLVQEKL